MTVIREVKEGMQAQGVNESIAYKITSTPWASTPVVTAVKAYDITTDGTRTDVTATVLPSGSSSVTGDIITLPPLTALTYAHTYRVEVKFTSGGNTFEAYFIVKCEY